MATGCGAGCGGIGCVLADHGAGLASEQPMTTITIRASGSANPSGQVRVPHLRR
jgi:hypothetical protein